jgi:hypothetical protein
VGFLIVILGLVLVGLVVLVVSAPLRRTRRVGDSGVDAAQQFGEPPASPVEQTQDEDMRERRERDELESAREAKYREIRDAELDFRTGKLSREDYQAIDTDLRAEAIEILDRLEALKPKDA